MVDLLLQLKKSILSLSPLLIFFNILLCYIGLACWEGSHSSMIASLAASQLLLFYNQAVCTESLIKIKSPFCQMQP